MAYSSPASVPGATVGVDRQLGQAHGQGVVYGRDPVQGAQQRVACLAQRDAVDGGDAGDLVGQGNHLGSYRPALCLVFVEHGVRGAVPEHGDQPTGQSGGILDACVHTLPAGRAVYVGGVTGQEHLSRAVMVGEPVVHPEWGAPYDGPDLGRLLLGAAGVQQCLDELGAGVFGRFVDGGHDAVPPAGQGRDDHQAGRGVVEHDGVCGQVPVHVHVGEHERLRIGVTGEADPGLLAHGAVHPIGADRIGSPDGVAGGHGGGHPTAGLSQAGELVGAVHLAAYRVQAFQQYLLGDVLGDHEGVRVVGGQAAEVDGHQHPVPVADGEAGDDQAAVYQLLADLQLTQDFEGAGVDYTGP